MSSSLSSDLVLLAFHQANIRRGNPVCILFHLDRGVQYTVTDIREIISKKLTIQSMSRKGNCWDNAVSESFFSTVKRKLMSLNESNPFKGN